MFVLVCSLFSHAQAQPADSLGLDIVDLLFGHKDRDQAQDTKRAGKRVHYSILPAAANAPGGTKAVITTVNAAFTLGDPELTNVSNIFLIPFTDFNRQYGLIVRPNIWLNRNSWNHVGDYRIIHFPQYTWGLGGNTQEYARSLIEEDYFRLYHTALKRLRRFAFIGPGYALDYHYNISEEEASLLGHLEEYPNGFEDPTVSSGITLNFAFDKRKNALNPQDGAYLFTMYRLNFKALGSTDDYQSVFTEGRKYFSLSKTRSNILAFRAYYWAVVNGEAPYLDLPATNRAPALGIASRGIRNGRYRSNAMLYFEGEQRVQLTDNGLLGLVAFLNVSSASEFDTQNFKHWRAGAGFGLRTKLNKYSNTNIAIDLGFSSNFWGVWLNVGEMF